MSSPMEPIIPGRVFRAGKGFTHRGLWVWTGRRNIRVIPFNRFLQWTGGTRG
jgi:hypothetical protein